MSLSKEEELISLLDEYQGFNIPDCLHLKKSVLQSQGEGYVN
jgi:hypothetical protein